MKSMTSSMTEKTEDGGGGGGEDDLDNLFVDCRYINTQWGHDLVSSRLKLSSSSRIDNDPAELTTVMNGSYDVSIVLSGCDFDNKVDSNSSENNNRRIWEKEIYKITRSVATTCVGKSFITSKSRKEKQYSGISYQQNRIELIRTLFTNEYNDNDDNDNDDNDEDTELLFPRIVDYDIGDYNIVVAFANGDDDDDDDDDDDNDDDDDDDDDDDKPPKAGRGISKWHWNEAQYQYELYRRIATSNDDGDDDESESESTTKSLIDQIEYFDSTDMLRLQFPSKFSMNSYCTYLDIKYDEDDEDDDRFANDYDEHMNYCDYGYDPYIENIPIDQIYVSQSTQGENAGRGVFTSVDIPQYGTHIGLETGVHPILYPPASYRLIEKMDRRITMHRQTTQRSAEEAEEDDEIDLTDSNSIHRILAVYGEAYGFMNQPWGTTEIAVCSHILTFVNHG